MKKKTKTELQEEIQRLQNQLPISEQRNWTVKDSMKKKILIEILQDLRKNIETRLAETSMSQTESI